MNASVPTCIPISKNDLHFRAPQPEDVTWAKPILMADGRMGCEFCFGNIYAWAEKYEPEIMQYRGFFLSRYDRGDGRIMHCLPQGKGELCDVLPLLRDDAHAHGGPLTLYGLTQEEVARLQDKYPGKFRFESSRGNSDYIYRREDLAALSGKKYHQKRNHIARFMRSNDWTCEAITPDVLDECLDMERRWIELNEEKDPEGLRQELRALERCFANYELFGMRGALLRSGGKIVAFTVGEPLNDKCFCTHFEKAFTDEPGAYQMINQRFAADFLQEFEFINREEDLGDEGLRRAKMSYYPEILLEKFTAVEIEDA